MLVRSQGARAGQQERQYEQPVRPERDVAPADADQFVADHSESGARSLPNHNNRISPPAHGPPTPPACRAAAAAASSSLARASASDGAMLYGSVPQPTATRTGPVRDAFGATRKSG